MKKHPLDTVSLVFGLIFAALAAWWAADNASDSELDGGWILVGGLVLLALITLIGTVTKRAARPAPVESTVENTVASTELATADPEPDDTEVIESPTAILDGDQRDATEPDHTVEPDDTAELAGTVRRPDDPTPGLRP